MSPIQNIPNLGGPNGAGGTAPQQVGFDRLGDLQRRQQPPAPNSNDAGSQRTDQPAATFESAPRRDNRPGATTPSRPAPPVPNGSTGVRRGPR